jgi:hypothetical protein
MANTSDSKLHILQHTLGLDQYGQGRQYRNHFVTGPNTDDWSVCCELTELELMRKHQPNALSGGSYIFTATQKGIDYVAKNSPIKPKESRSKQRYKRYREYGDGFDSFISYCCWDADRERSWNAAT